MRPIFFRKRPEKPPSNLLLSLSRSAYHPFEGGFDMPLWAYFRLTGDYPLINGGRDEALFEQIHCRKSLVETCNRINIQIHSESVSHLIGN